MAASSGIVIQLRAAGHLRSALAATLSLVTPAQVGDHGSVISGIGAVDGIAGNRNLFEMTCWSSSPARKKMWCIRWSTSWGVPQAVQTDASTARSLRPPHRLLPSRHRSLRRSCGSDNGSTADGLCRGGPCACAGPLLSSVDVPQPATRSRSRVAAASRSSGGRAAGRARVSDR